MCLTISAMGGGLIYWDDYLWAVKGFAAIKNEQGKYVLGATAQLGFVYQCQLIDGHITIPPALTEQAVGFTCRYYIPPQTGEQDVYTGIVSVTQGLLLGYHATLFRNQPIYPLHVYCYSESKGPWFHAQIPIRFSKDDVQAVGGYDIVVKSFQLPTPRELKDFVDMRREYANQLNECGVMCPHLPNEELNKTEFKLYSKLHHELVKTIEAKA